MQRGLRNLHLPASAGQRRCSAGLAEIGCRGYEASPMRVLLLRLFVCAAACAGSLPAGAQTTPRNAHQQTSLETLLELEKASPADVALLLRISRKYSDVVSGLPSPSAKREAAEKALAYAKRAVGLEPNNAKAHLSIAVAYGRLTDFVGNRTKLEYSRFIREEVGRSLELDPSDDHAWHVLGRWHAGVANVNPVLRAMAKVVYGGLPAASNEEAVKCLRKAAELAPRRISHRSELARVYGTIGQHELAAKEWKAVLALPSADAEDQKDKAEARAALARIR